MLNEIMISLRDILGNDYIQALCHARAVLTGEAESELLAVADEKVTLYPKAFQEKQNEMMKLVGSQIVPAFEDTLEGAPTEAYRKAQHMALSPLTGLGTYRLGEDGRLYFAGKSEHYQLSLGHSFPGYQLIDNAKKLGIVNATHNNTRGYVTRLTERRLIALANGLDDSDPELDRVLAKKEPGTLTSVINLETGSLVCEAALKMMLSRFYGLESKEAPYQDRIPVFLIMADYAGGVTGNYHGTTVLAQTLRGLWPGLREKMEEDRLYRVVSVPINDAAAFREIMEKYNTPPYKTAGFCHEIIMMNYGAVVLDKDWLQSCYELCHLNDTPVLCDEIQSCAWYEDGFLFRQYGLHPDFVSVGKGFPGGEYPASRLLVSGAYDSLSQFGALVTNGQEELASLAYLITMVFWKENGALLMENGRYYHQKLEELAGKYPELLSCADGDGFMSALRFQDMDVAGRFASILNGKYCVDASAQTYKKNCPPVVLTKLPLICSKEMMDGVCALMEKALLDCKEV